jgi:hypothetical protein
MHCRQPLLLKALDNILKQAVGKIESETTIDLVLSKAIQNQQVTK